MHRNAPFDPEGRLLGSVADRRGWPVAHAAASMGISRDRAYVWWRRYQEGGPAGSLTVAVGRIVHPTRPRPPWSAGSWLSDRIEGWDRPGSPASWACMLRRCIGSWSATG